MRKKMVLIAELYGYKETLSRRADAPRRYTRDTHVQHTVQAWPHYHNTPQRRRTHEAVLPASTRRGGEA